MPRRLFPHEKQARPKKKTMERINQVLKPRTAKKGRGAGKGAEDLLPAYIKRTLQLKRDGYHLWEIAEKIAEEFELEKVPAITTVCEWRAKGAEAMKEDIAELTRQLTFDQLRELEELKQKWMPIAIAQSLEIRRWQRVEGELQPVFDENALAEQVEATKVVVLLMTRQAKLVGLDLEKAGVREGDGPQTAQDLQLWLINQITINQPGAVQATAASGGNPEQMPKGIKSVIDIHADVLEMRAGIPEIDSAQDSPDSI